MRAIPIVIVIALFLIAPSNVLATPQITNLSTNPQNQVPRHQKLELTFQISPAYTNPYNPDEIKVDGYFTTPSGIVLIQPGFYYQAYNVTGIGTSETYTTSGSPVWKIRFTPQEIGTYQYYVKATDSSGSTVTPNTTFIVTTSNHPGFITISPENSRYFAYSNGQPFIGVGLDVPWWDNDRRRITTYQTYFETMQTYHSNFARIWMVNSGLNQTWIMSVQDSTLGNNYNQAEAYAFDQIVNLAEQHQINFLLTLDDVNQYTYNWPDNLYNSSRGGPCSYRSCIFTNAVARKYQQQIFRYVIARWGYSPNLLSFELFNEIDELEWSDPQWNRSAMITWHKDMAPYIQSIDAHHHLVNTSTGSFKTHPDLYEAIPSLAFAQIHFYYVPGLTYTPSSPAGQDMANLTRYYAYLVHQSVSQKPSLIGEFGLLNTNWSDNPEALAADVDGVHVHNSLWASLMSGMATTSLSWHWPEHLSHGDSWWRHYAAISQFFQTIDVRGLSPIKAINIDPLTSEGTDPRVATVTSTNPKLRVMGLTGSASTYLWVQNTDHTWWNKVNGTNISPQSGSITVGGYTANQSYPIEWWDTLTGTIINTTTLPTNSSGAITLSVSNLTTDIALKIGAPQPPPTYDYFDLQALTNVFGQSNSNLNLLGSSLIDIFDFNQLLSLF